MIQVTIPVVWSTVIPAGCCPWISDVDAKRKISVSASGSKEGTIQVFVASAVTGRMGTPVLMGLRL